MKKCCHLAVTFGKNNRKAWVDGHLIFHQACRDVKDKTPVLSKCPRAGPGNRIQNRADGQEAHPQR